MAGTTGHQHHETAPEDRIPFLLKIAYGLGAFVNNLLAAAIGGMTIVLNLGLGMNPALVGLLGAIPRLTDALTDPLMGYISDNARTKWGRRRPFIFLGAIAAGVIYVLLWQLPSGQSESFYFWYFLIGSLIFYLAYTCFATPWVALGYELTPDYHERTRLMGVQNFIGQLAYTVSPWFLWIMRQNADIVQGARDLSIIIGIFTVAVGILPALLLKERFQPAPAPPRVEAKPDDPARIRTKFETERRPSTNPLLENIKDFFRGFAATLQFRPFLKLCAATFLVFNGFILISSFQPYVIIYYVFAGDQDKGAEYAGYFGTISAVSTFLVIMFITWLGTRIGKRRAFFVSTGVSIFGYGLKWFCYDPQNPALLLIPAPFVAFGLGGLFTLMGSMIADVVDLDELETNERREGMFGSIYWWMVKLGMAAALAGGGVLLNATGFDVKLEGNQTETTTFLMRVLDVTVPMIASAIAILTVWSYPITEERAHEIRAELDRRKDLSKDLEDIGGPRGEASGIDLS